MMNEMQAQAMDLSNEQIKDAWVECRKKLGMEKEDSEKCNANYIQGIVSWAENKLTETFLDENIKKEIQGEINDLINKVKLIIKNKGECDGDMENISELCELASDAENLAQEIFELTYEQ